MRGALEPAEPLPADGAGAAPASRWPGFAAAALIALTGAVAFAWSWGRWAHPWIDFGRELYIPWRLLAGERLYADLAYFNGPLSPHWNRLVFALGGVSLRSLVLANLALTVALVVLLYRLLAAFTGRLPATLAALVFLTCFAFKQLEKEGNYNYLTPYSHELSHGLLLSLAAIACLRLYPRVPRAAIALSGFALGLVFLTKAEVFAAAALGVPLGWLLTLLAERPPLRRAGAALALFAGSALLPPLVALLLLWRQMPLAEAAFGTLGSWRYALSPELASMPFYKLVMGTYKIDLHALRFVGWVGRYAVAAAGAAGVALALRRLRRFPRSVAAAAGVGAALLAWGGVGMDVWKTFVCPLPAVLLLALVLSARSYAARLRARDETGLLALRISLTLFSLALLAKVILNVTIVHYGFGLAMPGTLLLVVMWTHDFPRWLDAWEGAGRIARAIAVGTVIVFMARAQFLIADRFGARTIAFGRGADAFLAAEPASLVGEALDAIDALPPNATLAVLPEGIMLNYQARRVNPTGHVNFLPPELTMFGEAGIVAAFASRPPDYVLLLHRKTEEYRLPWFGRDYGVELKAWIDARYRPLRLFGDPPLVDGSRFGLLLLERADAAREWPEPTP